MFYSTGYSMAIVVCCWHSRGLCVKRCCFVGKKDEVHAGIGVEEGGDSSVRFQITMSDDKITLEILINSLRPHVFETLSLSV